MKIDPKTKITIIYMKHCIGIYYLPAVLHTTYSFFKSKKSENYDVQCWFIGHQENMIGTDC